MLTRSSFSIKHSKWRVFYAFVLLLVGLLFWITPRRKSFKHIFHSVTAGFGVQTFVFFEKIPLLSPARMGFLPFATLAFVNCSQRICLHFFPISTHIHLKSLFSADQLLFLSWSYLCSCLSFLLPLHFLGVCGLFMTLGRLFFAQFAAPALHRPTPDTWSVRLSVRSSRFLRLLFRSVLAQLFEYFAVKKAKRKKLCSKLFLLRFFCFSNFCLNSSQYTFWESGSVCRHRFYFLGVFSSFCLCGIFWKEFTFNQNALNLFRPGC